MPRKSHLKTKNRPAADLDQVSADLASPMRTRDLLYRQPDDDLPGAGQYYCVACARHMTDRQALLEHRRGKPHKRRLKELGEAAYTQSEAEAAGGLGAYQNPASKRKLAIEPLKPELGLPPTKASRLVTADAVARDGNELSDTKQDGLEPEAMRTGTRDL